MLQTSPSFMERMFGSDHKFAGFSIVRSIAHYLSIKAVKPSNRVQVSCESSHKSVRSSNGKMRMSSQSRSRPAIAQPVLSTQPPRLQDPQLEAYTQHPYIPQPTRHNYHRASNTLLTRLITFPPPSSTSNLSSLSCRDMSTNAASPYFSPLSSASIPSSIASSAA